MNLIVIGVHSSFRFRCGGSSGSLGHDYLVDSENRRGSAYGVFDSPVFADERVPDSFFVSVDHLLLAVSLKIIPLRLKYEA